MEQGATERCIAAMSDPGMFERLATAVLRAADSQCGGLIHTGVNLDGRTIPAPEDGIAFVEGANPPHMIVMHHTTCGRTALKKKWLHGFANAGPSTPHGDFVKATRLFEKQKHQITNLRATLILTTNKEPDAELVCQVNTLGAKAGLGVRIWSGSRLAYFLDHDATGQWIRQRFFGIDQERLSGELLRDLSRSSLLDSNLPDDCTLWIDRQLDQRLEDAVGSDVVLIVGEPGLGKSVACYKRLRSHIEKGGSGIIISHRTIAEAPSLELAIDRTLRHLHPSLAQGQGREALSLASVQTPLLMIVEDINKSTDPTQIIERIVKWGTQRKKRDQVANWQLLCPVWPQILVALSDQVRKKVSELVLLASTFTAAEGVAAVRRRWKHSGVPISRLGAEEVAVALGKDPLLIALQDPARVPNPDNVIQSFIDGSLARLAEHQGNFTAGEYRNGLRRLAARMLEQRCLDISMTEIVSWFRDTPDIPIILRHIVHFREVIRAIGPSLDERLAFRHDRVRDWLLADAADDLLCREAMPEAVLTEPFYAEFIGMALVRGNVRIAVVKQVGSANPLALFCAMRYFGKSESANDLYCAIVESAKQWLGKDLTHGSQYASLRLSACRALSETDARHVISLVKHFRNEKTCWWGLRASFRNGDLVAGIKLCSQFRPGLMVAGHVELIHHVQQNRGTSAILALNGILRRSSLKSGFRSGALRLAGYLGDPALADAIKTSWLTDASRDTRLADYLWAAAQCCSDDAAELLAPVCDSWAALPDETEEEYSSSPRNNLASHEIRFAFQEKLPEPAILYFIERTDSSDLRWPITYMLHGIDHPAVVEFLARELAASDESFPHLLTTIESTWSWRQESTGRAMSDASRHRLHEMWANRSNEKRLRELALRLWCSTTAKEDIPVLQTVSTGDDIETQALFQRLKRGDHEATSSLIEKLRQDTIGYWWRAGRHIWSDELTTILDAALHRRGEQMGRTWSPTSNYSLDEVLSESLMELPTRTAEELLIKHWCHLRYSSYYVQVALYTATPRLTKIAEKAISQCTYPESVFKRLGLHFGLMIEGRRGITRMEQLEALLPYFEYLSDDDFRMLWDVCNRNGWFVFRHQHLDPHVRSDYTDDTRAMANLDDMFRRGQPFFLNPWIEKFFEAGASVDHVMEVVQNWLIRQTDIKALVMAADIVANYGRRCHGSILCSHNIEATDKAQSIIANASFALKRRSLN